MAVRFDAATDRISWSGTAPTPSSGLTITLWAYVSVDRDDYSTLIRLHGSSGATTNLNVAMDSGGLSPSVFTAGGTSNGPQALAVGAWARVAVTVNGTASTIYVAQGAAGATQSQAGTVGANAAVSPNSGYTVGGRASGDSSEWYNGRVAYLRVWSTVLTQAQIEAEWASPTPVRVSNLFADYPLLSAADLTDHSGNARHLSAGSTAVSTEGDPPVASTVAAVLAATLPPLAAGAAGAATAAGQLVTTLPPMAVGAAGAATTGGQHTGDLPALSAAVAGGASFTAGVDAALPPLAATAAGGVQLAGQAAVTLPPLTVDLDSGAALDGYLAAPLPGLTVAAHGAVLTPVAGALAAALPALTMASGRVRWPPAVEEVSVAALAVTGPEDIPWVAVS